MCPPHRGHKPSLVSLFVGLAPRRASLLLMPQVQRLFISENKAACVLWEFEGVPAQRVGIDKSGLGLTTS